MTLRDLRVQTFKERKEGKLTPLPADFYVRANQLEKQIREVITNAKGNTSRYEKANTDIRKFLDMKLELHKNRERKLTDLAREKINGQNPNTSNVHSNEEEYLQSICSVIENYRKQILMSKEVINLSNNESKSLVKEKPIEEEIKEEKIGKKESIVEELRRDNEYIQVEILEDLPTFIGMDAKNYTLKNKEIEKIPIYNAKILSDAGKVKILKEVKV